LKSWHNNTDIQWWSPYTKYENKTINNIRNILKPGGDLFHTHTNPNNVFSRGTYNSFEGSHGPQLLSKAEEIKDCANSGSTLCDSTSNCDLFSYHRHENDEYSYCELREFNDGVNPENDVSLVDFAPSTIWIKNDITLSS
jgi:hypothetical protein